MSGVIGASVGGECHRRRQWPAVLSLSAAGCRRAMSSALLAALFAAIPHRALMRYGEHSCKKLKKAPKGEPMAEIVSCTDEFEEYLRDESRSVGSAESIVFPESETDVRDALHALHAQVCLSPCRARVPAWRLARFPMAAAC